MAKRPLPLYSCSQKWVKEPVNSSSFADPDARVNNENSTIVQVEDFSVQATNVTFGTFRLPEFLINFVGGTETFNLEIPEEVLAKLNETIVTSDPSYIPPTAVPAVPTPVVLTPTPASPQQPVLQAVIVEQAKNTASTVPVPSPVTSNAETGIAEPVPVIVAAPVVALPQRVHISSNTIYLGTSPNSPQIGDVRVTFKHTLPTTVSLIA